MKLRRKDVPSPILLPTKEVLSLMSRLSLGDISTDWFGQIFDASYAHLLQELFEEKDKNWKRKHAGDPRVWSVLPKIVEEIGGRYEFERGELVFQAGRYVEKRQTPESNSAIAQIYSDNTKLSFDSDNGLKVSTSMTAEGFRKLGILQRLVENGLMLGELNRTLLWDEPEANMNPKLMRSVVEILLELSRNGQQIILTTHDYVLLKWFDLLVDKGNSDNVRFHILSRDKNSNRVSITSCDEYYQIDQNAISDAFSELYDADIERALGK